MLATQVMNREGKIIWQGQLPILNKGQRINSEGISYQVLDAAVGLYMGETGSVALQNVVVEEKDE